MNTKARTHRQQLILLNRCFSAMQNSDDGARSEDVTRYLCASSIFPSPNLHLKISCEKVEEIRDGEGVRMAGCVCVCL